jgi:hypothetical protein
MHISYEDLTLLETQSFLALGLGVTTIKLGEGGESLTFLLDFIKSDLKKQSIKLEVINDKTLKFILENWDSVLGSGLVEPLGVGVYIKKKLFIALHVQKTGTQSQLRLITISFYLGKEVGDGQN